MLSRVRSVVRRDEASSGLALHMGERNSAIVPSDVVLPGPQWCKPICSCCFTASATTRGRLGPAVFISFPVAVKRTNSDAKAT